MSKFQFGKNKNRAAKPPDLSVALSVKDGDEYVKGPSFGLWANEEEGPAFRGSLKGEYLDKILEFMDDALKADLSVSLAVFDHSNDDTRSPGFKARSRFGKKTSGFGKKTVKKTNPFNQQEEESEEDNERVLPF